MFNRHRLRELRNRHGYTQAALAEKLKTTKGTISNYENDHSTPSDEMLALLADLLFTTTDYLLDRTSDSSPARQADGEPGSVDAPIGKSSFAYFEGQREELSKDEATHLKESLEMYRLLKEKRLADKKQQK